MHRALAEVTDPGSIPTGGPGTGPRPRPGPTRTSPRSWSARPAGAGARRAGGGGRIPGRAAALTLDPARRAGRALAAAQAKVQAGAFDAALELLAMAEAGPLSELQHARADLVRAQLAFVHQPGQRRPAAAAQGGRAARARPGLARETYLDALSAAIFAGRLASPGSSVLEVAWAAGGGPAAPQVPRAHDLLLDGLAAHYNEGYAAGVPMLRAALTAFGARHASRRGTALTVAGVRRRGDPGLG